MMASYTIVDASTEEITPNLRWNNGVLQQAWNIIHYTGGVPHKLTTQWRDVPQANDGGQQLRNP